MRVHLSVIFLFLYFNLNIKSFAHRSSRSPGQEDSNEVILSPYKGSYGSLIPVNGKGIIKSEAQSATFFNDQCDQEEFRQVLASKCLDGEGPLRMLGGHLAADQVVKKMREQTSEYLLIKITEFSPDFSQKDRVGCLDGYRDLEKKIKIARKTNLKAKECNLNYLAEECPGVVRKSRGFLEQKVNAVDYNAHPASIIFKMQRYELLSNNEKIACSMQVFQLNSNQCRTIKNEKSRIAQSTPEVFKLISRKNKGYYDHWQDSDKLEIKKINNYNKLMGKINLASIEQSGLIETINQMTNATNMSTLKSGAIIYQAEAGRETNKLRLEVYQDLMNAKRTEAKRAEVVLRNLCKSKKLFNSPQKELKYLVNKYPNVFRQMIIDSPKEFGLLGKYAMCNLIPRSNLKEPFFCKGVKKNSKDGIITVDTPATDNYPYVAEVKFNMKKTVSSKGEPTLEINYPVNFVLNKELLKGNDSNGDGLPDHVECEMKKWENDVKSYFNCQSGALKKANYGGGQDRVRCDNAQVEQTRETLRDCPRREGTNKRPKIKFNFNYSASKGKKSGKLNIKLHKAYHADLNLFTKTSSEKIKKYFIKKCSAGNTDWILASQCVAQRLNCSNCYDLLKKENPENFTRADSGNYILGMPTGTLRHEMAHALGMPDEYYDETRPIDPMGSDKSILNNSRIDDPVLEDHHFDKIYNYLECADK